MDWLAPINTLIGAGIGVGSTLLADRFRWHRERVRVNEEARRRIYSAFMGALSETYQTLYEITRDGNSRDEPRATAAYDAFRAGNLYPLRYQLVLIAPRDVVEPTNQAFWKVRTLRDLVATGATVDQKEFRQLLDEYIAAAEEAQVAMRKDLGTSWKRDQRV
jgi:hypothetical protein